MATKTSVMKDFVSKDNAGVVLYRGGETATGIAIDVNPYRILLELPGGVTGIITKKEATGFGATTEDVAIGQAVEAMIIDPEDTQGLVVLSLRRASQDMAWAELNTMQDEKRIIKVKIEEANKGGLMASYKGLKAFLPVSQLMPLNYPRVNGAEASAILSRLQSHIGKEFAVCIINVDPGEEKIILSEKEAYKEQSVDTLKNLEVGDRVEGQVSGIVKFGIFVTFGGVEGLVHLSEIDWGHVSNPGDRFTLGDKVEVLVIGVDGDKLSFSVKQLHDDPWLKKVSTFKEGSKVSGKILRWNAQGVFIELAADVQGFFSLDQFGVASHSELKIRDGESMEGTIKSINSKSHRIELQKTGAAVATEEKVEKEVAKPEETKA